VLLWAEWAFAASAVGRPSLLSFLLFPKSAKLLLCRDGKEQQLGRFREEKEGEERGVMVPGNAGVVIPRFPQEPTAKIVEISPPVQIGACV